MDMTLETLLEKNELKDEMDLVQLSDETWKIGTLEEIKRHIEDKLFVLHVGCNIIGNWKGGGWHSIMSDHSRLVPYIPDVLEALGLKELNKAFQHMIAVFPEFVTFGTEDKVYCDVINFFTNSRFKVGDERLNHFTEAERKSMILQYKKRIQALEDLSEPLWGYDGPQDGWGVIFDYIESMKIKREV